jgi:hypothetical protein
MQYWNGTVWVVVAATVNEAATLQMIGGVPTWTGGTPPPPAAPAIGILEEEKYFGYFKQKFHSLVCALKHMG